MASLKSNSDDSSITALKQQLRRQLKQTRQTLDPHRRNQGSIQACEQLLEWIQSADLVLSFASIGSEINLWHLNQNLASEGRLALPRLVEGRLCLFRVAHLHHLEQHAWGFLEPKISHCGLVDFSHINIALIPGLGFDLETKHRLGYGQGYYDRLLVSNYFHQTWGIGFLEQAVNNLPHTSHDIALNRVYLF
jgi:5-formyltetrahydrofolate cyclo-ligase